MRTRYGGIARYRRSGGVGPAWARNATPLQWGEFAGTNYLTDLTHPSYTGVFQGNGPREIMCAWGGSALRVKNGEVRQIFNGGGHSNYAGNQVVELVLEVDTPFLRTIVPGTAQADIIPQTFSGSPPPGPSRLYADDRPNATHTYYTLQFNNITDELYRCGNGSGWSAGGASAGDYVERMTYAGPSSDWRPSSENTLQATGLDNPSVGICKHPLNDEIDYLAGSGHYRRINPDYTLSTIASVGFNPQIDFATCIDPIRNRFLRAPSPYDGTDRWFWLDRETGALTDFTPTGDVPSSPYKGVMHFDIAGDRILFIENDWTVTEIDPDSFACRTIATTGTPPQNAGDQSVTFGLFNKCQWIESYGCLVGASGHDENMMYLKVR